MNTYLRLDLYINGKEYLIDESREASAQELEASIRVARIPFASVDADLAAQGFALLTAEQIADEDMQDKLWDITGYEVKATDEVQYVMCLWQRDEETGEVEHLQSHAKISDFE